MRRTYGATIALVALLLLGLATAGNAPAAAFPAPGAPSAGGPATATAHPPVPDGTRKLPPPPGSVQPAPADPNYRPLACLAPVGNVSQTPGNQAESFVVINPTNPNNLVVFSNLASGNSIFRAYSLNGGTTWTRGTVATNGACCDGQAVFDTFGNLFLVYINGAVNQINVILSTDGGATFSAPVTAGTGSVDQPSIAVGNGSVWVDWNLSGNMVARGAPVTGLGAWGPFGAQQTIPSATGSFGGIAVGPGPNGGAVMVTYENPTGGQGPATLYVNVDADGLGAGGFGARITATSTNVGGFDFIPAQSGRSIDAEAGLVWDATGGPFNNRVYLVYTEEPVNESNDTEIYLRTSTDMGTTWTAPVRVNDDPLGPIRSQFLPYIALDHTSGTVAIGWHDARNDNGVPGSGGTNTTPNDDAEYYASYSTDGGVTWAPNTRLSGGFSNAADAANGVDYGDYVGTDAYGGKFVAVWADNANCDGTNPDGSLHAFDLYMSILNLGGGGTPTATPTGTLPTATRTATPAVTPSATRTATPMVTNTALATVTPPATATATGTPPATATGTPPATLTPRASTPTGTATPPGIPTTTATPPPPVTLTPGGPPPSSTPSSTVGPATHTPGPSPTPCPLSFTDVHATDYFYTPVLYLACHGVISGYSNGDGTVSFRPYNNTTRSQMVKIVVLGYGKPIVTPPGGNNTFADVLPSNPFFAVIETAAADAIVSGYNCGGPGEPCDSANRPYFRPYANVTRGQLSKIDVVAAGWALINPATPSFEDVVPGTAFYSFVETAYCHGIISGYTCGGVGEPCDSTNRPYFRQYNQATRGQITKIVYLSVTSTSGGCAPAAR
ncbi:MAG TPA: S-layer homology domain-containing protein [Chloroflexia bacterium]|nr:S-layer homology domain-containing protein [Chloroflexia bacterium]